MAIYSAYIYMAVQPDIQCYQGFKHTKLHGMHDKFDGDIDMFADVAWMFLAHMVCIAAIMFRNCFTSKNNVGTLARSLLGGIKVWFYLLALLGVMVADC